jgi:hypothetical protein
VGSARLERARVGAARRVARRARARRARRVTDRRTSSATVGGAEFRETPTARQIGGEWAQGSRS